MLIGNLEWDLDALAKEMHLTIPETLEYFKDGRRCSFVT